jgi:hypothetical protein
VLKKRKENIEVDEPSSITPIARVYPWTSNGLDRHTLGDMNYECQNCGAMMWLNERVNKSARSPVFTTCCAKGKILLPPLQDLLPPLDRLLTELDQNSRLFRQNIRMYNSALSFTSIGAKIDNHITGTRGVYSFRIHGEIYHSIGTLLPNNEDYPQFAQIYIYDTDNELQNRMNIMPNLDPNILTELQQMLNDVNPYVETFRQASDMLRSNQLLDMKMVITDKRTTDPREAEFSFLAL